jgi:hypothetical protein
MRLVKKWDSRHKVRYIGYGTAWLAGFVALLAAAGEA